MSETGMGGDVHHDNVRIAYLDCPSGVSGDMLLGALLDVGLDADALRAVLATLPLPSDSYTLTAAPVRRGALGATQARVELARHEHAHRHLSDVLDIIARGGVPSAVKERTSAVFRRLAAAEAHVHRVDIEEVHFHEVGAVDAIVDIVGVCAGLHLLGVDRLYCSPLPLGRGHVQTEHGLLPLPAPAVLQILAGADAPTVPHAAALELVTPTGAALVAELASFAQPAMRLERVGYGAGTRAEPAPNLLRLWLGRPVPPHPSTPAPSRGEGEEGSSLPHHDVRVLPPSPAHGTLTPRPSPAAGRGVGGEGVETLMVLEANIDDMPAELFGHAMERLLVTGALDAWCSPLLMKKGRPATLLSALCRPGDRAAVLDVLMRETSTFGVRGYEVTRYAAGRETREVETPYGAVRVKLKLLDGVVAGLAPEYEDCRRVAAEQSVPLPLVYAAALAAGAAFYGSSPTP